MGHFCLQVAYLCCLHAVYMRPLQALLCADLAHVSMCFIRHCSSVRVALRFITYRVAMMCLRFVYAAV